MGEEAFAPSPIPSNPSSLPSSRFPQLPPDKIEIVEPISALGVVHPNHRRVAIPVGGLLHDRHRSATRVLHHAQRCVRARHLRAHVVHPNARRLLTMKRAIVEPAVLHANLQQIVDVAGPVEHAVAVPAVPIAAVAVAAAITALVVVVTVVPAAPVVHVSIAVSITSPAVAGVPVNVTV